MILEKFKSCKDKRWLNRYLRFIERFGAADHVKDTHKHHILPKSIYPEYESFSKNKWNCSFLTYRAHVIAHYMLAKALGGKMWFAFNQMSNCHKGLNSSLYAASRLDFNIQNSLKKMNTVCCIDTNSGKKCIISKSEFRNNPRYIGVTKGLFCGELNVSKRQDVKDKISAKLSGRVHCIEKISGKRRFIKSCEYDEDTYEIIVPVYNSGFTAVRTENGIKRISTEDFKNSEFEHFNKGRKRSKEFKAAVSKKMKGVKKQETNNYNKCRVLTSPSGEEFEFLGNKVLQKFCYDKNLSLTILNKNKGVEVLEITKAKNPKLIETSKNTIGWKLIIKEKEIK